MTNETKGKEKATTPDENSTRSDGEKGDTDDTESNKGFECNICLENATDPVVSYCGHLFCWPCINTWLEINSKNLCPVCKASIGKDKVVPLYGRNNPGKVDPSTFHRL
ncbi:hypothetical protein SARC_07931 [Sphaeroforma arctica JP610]|uniref:RING-type E3 ubiquitin transferase n=1 Tax=Sphaeroforma arctica JP610 TaxID=667725 RepID=A0A0L0FSM5_9EUKA|nr:hypothetical protein SARC_07931 [Sphaeroforma arctica JP610]KNC79684.1 hypothetical protein SARC_07931 [Sphaeroforma arctica JP610]|eukprot:XP_014153586.1 hypothetical protein SARC_07931 [Sphaeroforma arctica JP610]